MSLDGVIYLVKLLEIPLEDVGIVDDARIAWPEEIDHERTPSIDGVLALVDISDEESIEDVPDVLSKWFQSCHSIHIEYCDGPAIIHTRPVFTTVFGSASRFSYPTAKRGDC